MTITATRVERAPSLPRGRRERRWRRLAISMCALLVLLCVGYVLLGLGNVLSPADAWHALVDRDDAPLLHRLAIEVRLPRMVLCLIAGSALAVAGALLQALTRNPLASPELTGVTAGAVAAAVAWVAFAPPLPFVRNIWGRPAAATAGALLAAGVVYLLTRRAGSLESTRLLLMGILVAGVLTSVTTLGLMFLGPDGQRMLDWLSGSMALKTWTDVALSAVYLVPGLILLLVATGRANALQLGDDVARSLGQRPELDRLLVLLTAVLLTAGVVSIVGAIGFVGLMAPHMVRGLVGSDLRRLIPAAALLGAMMVLVADLAARNIDTSTLFFFLGGDIRDTSLPAGVILTLFGVPYLASLLWRRT